MMNNNLNFYKWFDSLGDKLGNREISFRKIFKYLDSFDVDWRYPYPSAAHHLKELTAINKILRPETLVVVDDSPANGNLSHTDDASKGTWEVLKSPSPPPSIGGKGFLVHEYASHVRANLLFSHYQADWINFNK